MCNQLHQLHRPIAASYVFVKWINYAWKSQFPSWIMHHRKRVGTVVWFAMMMFSGAALLFSPTTILWWWGHVRRMKIVIVCLGAASEFRRNEWMTQTASRFTRTDTENQRLWRIALSVIDKDVSIEDDAKTLAMKMRNVDWSDKSCKLSPLDKLCEK